ncbi:effector-associated domain EAD1-containing protein [Streptomyces sp. DSM 40750]|uniref:effector-associated domain EAD1-containing protein n=1 Tax=Streptomyces sp. DSM 40750 TaxID=2801030 RepID=UPI00214C94EF|nr:effector-associated domain EAD1-containing protein [Streptomyces sp. DSM 40750]UUU19289.1 effector-associated domain EAD1-containing protein [Streptomyces sp. DSM 40750]UUU27368.1 effector-associated domain EAD1-containing protein [Streptomyces sp. DSM 40750]
MPALIDDCAFNLDDERAKNLLKALITVYGNKHTARQLILSAGLKEGDINWENSMADVWPEALEKAAPAGRLRALVETAAADPNTTAHPVFQYLLTEETSSQEADPCSVYLVNNRQRAFFNRLTFRTTLHDMVTGGGKRVLAVRGQRRSGRTHSWYLIAHVLDSYRVNRRRIRMSDYYSPVRVADIGHTLRELFGWNISIDLNTSEDSQARSLVNQIENVMNEEQRDSRAQSGHWLVIDDSESVRFTEPALRALTRLVAAVIEEEMADRLRIVLLAYDGWLPSDLQSYVCHEELTPLTGKDLHDYVLAVAKEAGKPVDPDQADHLANELSSRSGGGDVTADAPLPMTDRLQLAAASWAREQYARGERRG